MTCLVCSTYSEFTCKEIERAGREHHEELESIRSIERRGGIVTHPSGSVTYNQLILQDRLTTEALREAPCPPS